MYNYNELFCVSFGGLMKQVKKAGIKEFILALFIIFLIMTVLGYIKFITPSYTLVIDIIAVISFVIYGFLVLTRYGAEFTYTVTDTDLRLNRTIGKRNSEVEIPISSIISVTQKKPDTKYIKNFSPYITVGKKSRYITFNKNRLEEAVIIVCDRDMAEFLNKHIQEGI